MGESGRRATHVLAWIRGDHVVDARERRVRFVLLFLLVAVLVHLLTGDNPWHDGIAKRVRNGDPVRPIDYSTTYGWWMAVVNAAVLGCLFATRRRWLGAASSEMPPGRARTNPRWFAPVVAGAVLATGLLAAPRLDDSLWGDEEWTVYRAIDGRYVKSADGEIDFEVVKWRDTFFDYRKPSNHVGYSVMSRLSLGAWRLIERPSTRMVSEVAIRLPAFLAGLAAVVAIAMLMRELGAPRAGVVAAWALAIHPWHLRYASEARGYSLVVLGVPLSLWLLLRAVERGTWSRWAAYGATQFVMLWALPLAAVPVLVMNVAAIGLLWRSAAGGAEACIQWTRWVVACGVGALVWLQLMLGNMVLFSNFVEREMMEMGERWFVSLAAHLVAGVSWAPDRPDYHELIEVAVQWPLIFWTFVAASAGMLLLGAVRLLAGGMRNAVMALMLLLPGPLMILLAMRGGDFLNSWYLLFALPLLISLIALGLDRVAAPLPEGRTRDVGTAVVMLAWLGLLAFVSQPARQALLATSLEPVRESVLLTRPTLDPFDPANDAVLTASFERLPDYYDPRVEVVKHPRELRALMRRADAEGKDLFVNYGRPKLARKRHRELVKMVGRQEWFEPVATLPGFEPRGVRIVLHYRPGSDQ
ncbi:MAG: glycosyltransferase family 39 protein [Deltaproteobacteria bacterium]|nr:glycosyltransferase family 39 protein [Deltaproteobacteria bacterium]MBW2394677.1 glycosyltransferase family 39 protein [Deltaproteobacteria bacterium]